MIHTRASKNSGISIIDAEKKYFSQNLAMEQYFSGTLLEKKPLIYKAFNFNATKFATQSGGAATIYNELRSNDVSKNIDYITKAITKKVLSQRDTIPKYVIDAEINRLNGLFQGMNFGTVLTGFTADDLEFKSTNRQKISFNELSAGEKNLYYLGFALNQIDPKNGILLIDEPEDSLHPTWQQQLVRFYNNVGENNQVFLATHSPHIIAAVPAENLFLLKPENGKITVSQPKYSKGHSVAYVLSEIMDTDYRNTYTNRLVDEYLSLIRTGEHENEHGKTIWAELELLDAASEERMQIDFALRRYLALKK